MIRNFKFFEGFRGPRVVWRADHEAVEDLTQALDAEQELTRLLSEQILTEIDNEMINTLLGEIQYNQRA